MRVFCHDSDYAPDYGSMLAIVSQSKPTANRPWSKEEDNEIVAFVDRFGPRSWSLIASRLPGRKGKQCRERWYNQLDPSINTLPWTASEDFVLIQAHQAVPAHFFLILCSPPAIQTACPLSTKELSSSSHTANLRSIDPLSVAY